VRAGTACDPDAPDAAGHNTRLNQSTEQNAETSSRSAPAATKNAVTSTLRVRSMTMRALRCS
jgi:hypothetical protein